MKIRQNKKQKIEKKSKNKIDNKISYKIGNIFGNIFRINLKNKKEYAINRGKQINSYYFFLKSQLKNLKIFLIGVLSTIVAFALDPYVLSNMYLFHNYFLISFFKIITLLGNIEFFFIIFLVSSIMIYFNRRIIHWFIISTVIVSILVFVLKILTNRLRPFMIDSNLYIINAEMSGFPSGHAMMMFSIIPFLAKNFPKYRVYFFIVAILVAVSRVYLNVHYLSDVVAGAFLGYVIGKFFSDLEDKLFIS
ncbi:MAG: hypothetical protein KatS3mg002_1417 [Candidatus Woesearchaeota archaeon]|nr:MAG: hypothetical protein KatS3mg002_1417 [Candidatus Woesearchaeota archaeon]